jgi:hypothetical protein
MQTHRDSEIFFSLSSLLQSLSSLPLTSSSSTWKPQCKMFVGVIFFVFLWVPLMVNANVLELRVTLFFLMYCMRVVGREISNMFCYQDPELLYCRQFAILRICGIITCQFSLHTGIDCFLSCFLCL